MPLPHRRGVSHALKKMKPLFVTLLLFASFAAAADVELGSAPFEAVGESGYVRNKFTGEIKVGSPELVRLNNALKKSWERLGYKCTIDCSGHQAGWDWAEDNEINRKSDCEGASRSFIEGCHAYVRYGKND